MLADASANLNTGTLQGNPIWVPSGRANLASSSIFSQYLLSLELADTLPPHIISTTLPPEGTVSSNIVDRFSITFSEDMLAPTVTNTANYELRSAGGDDVFETADDVLYRVANSPAYSSGLTASYLVTDAPLQAGLYRFTVRTNLADRPGNAMTEAYVQNFAIAGVPGFVLENRSNNSGALATSLSLGRVNTPDGSLTFLGTQSVGRSGAHIALGYLNSDTNLDLVVANYDDDNVSILLGNGDGTFERLTNYATGNGAWSVALGNCDADLNLDLAVGNYLAGTLTVLSGNGDGTFEVRSNYTVGTNPYSVATGDFNADGRLDLVVANYGSDNLSVLLGNGDGSFNAAVNYPVGDGPYMVKAADMNGDDKLDLVTANGNSDNVSLLLGNGNGTFSPAVNVAADDTPRALVLADLNNDSKLDLAVFNAGNNTISLMWGNGDGSFQTRVNIPAGTSDGRQLLAVDVNGDGWLDLAAPGMNNDVLAILLNRGDGTFEPPSTYYAGDRPIGLAAGDLNHDGRVDFVLGDDYGNGIAVLLGNNSQPLASDSADGRFALGAGRGNLFNNSDVDYWSFTAHAGDLYVVAAENPGNPSATGLRYVLNKPDGNSIDSFYTDYYGRGQMVGTLPVTGTYTVRVENNYTYPGEYRLRVTLAQPPLQLETEDNNNTSQADPLTFTLAAGHRTASVLGYVPSNDTSGDYFQLGNLTPGSTVSLRYALPNSSPLLAVLEIRDSSGVVTNVLPGTTNLLYSVGAADAYYAHIYAASNTAGLFAQYILTADVSDATPPAVTSLTLPEEGATNVDLIESFTLNVNKDLAPDFSVLNRTILTYGDHAYTLTDGTGRWLDAENQARVWGGDLVTINDSAENGWLQSSFGSFGNLWIGLTDEAEEGSFVWVSGQAVTYTNWASGQPDNSGNSDYGVLLSSGQWADYAIDNNLRGLLEVAGPDSDGDGIPDTLDPYPADPYNLFDLRAAGDDGIFDTADDQIYPLIVGSYSGGLSVSFSIANGPLQPGEYRFRVTTSLRDQFGNVMPTSFTRYFAMGNLPGYVVENQGNNTAATATPLAMIEDPPGMKSGGGRGRLTDNSDSDYWSFEGAAGNRTMLATDVPGNPGGSQLRYRVYAPDGSQLTDFYPSYYGDGQTGTLTLTTNGTYTVLVTVNYSYHGEYRLRVTTVAPPVQLETEDNGSIGGATPVTLSTSGETRFVNVAGYIHNNTDLDYFNLGTISNGYSVFLNVRQPVTSSFAPVVSLYNAANAYQTEAPGGRPADAVAEVRVTQTSAYYAVVRSGDNTSGLREQYVLDVQVVPTGSVSFPNLQVTTINLPTGAIQSGQTITYSFSVQNNGSLATPSANWSDRAVLSQNQVLGDGDDLVLGFFPHSGILDPGGSYSVTNTFGLPEGISGDFYLIVQTDSGNQVNEVFLEGDNITVSGSTFHINLAPYPDLKVEALSVSGPDASSVWTIAWNTANHGTLAAPAGFRDRVLVRNLSTGGLLLNTELTNLTSLAVNAALPHQVSVVASNAGVYQVQVTTDSHNDVYEFDAISHTSAEQNTVVTNFSITQNFVVTVQSSPAGAGILTGAGTYASGSAVVVTARANTNLLPYQFVNWTEGGTFQSARTNYTFIINRDRTLTASFTLPSYQIAASNNPPTGGTVSGQGTFFYGTTNTLTAHPGGGYLFTNWTENGVVVGTSNNLTTVVTSNRFVVANYTEANVFHVVTTSTSPTNLATVDGSGTYTNGETAAFRAPLSITNPPNIYNFREFRVNGTLAGKSPSFNKTFSTLDPTNLQYVAYYDTVSILPIVVQITPGFTNAIVGGFTIVTNPVPAATNYQIALRFDRSMNTSVPPAIVITNSVAAVQPFVPTSGVWFASSVSNDTYRTPFITFSNGMDGPALVRVSGSRDPQGVQMAATNVAALVIDVTPPLNPTLTLTASNTSSATVSWSGYAAPPDLNGFRLYLRTNSFASVTGLAAVSSVGAGARSFTYYGLSLDQPYYGAVVAVDTAGNSSPTVTALPFTLPASVPPPVSIQVTAVGLDSASISWNGYNTSLLLGFAGFRLYYENSDFTSVAGLTAKQSFSTGTRSMQIDSLDRAKTYRFAVVGYNANGAFNPNVTTAAWSDPYAGNISANLTIGGAGQNVVDIYQNMTVVNNAVLTIQPGTRLRFAPGKGLSVEQGRLNANGTPLDPIVFTSAHDQSGQTPAAGDWSGITLGSGAGASVLRNVFVQYGAGLTLSNCAPTVGAFTARYNTPAGLSLKGSATLTTGDALLAANDTGAQQAGSAQLTVTNSVLKNNGTNALALGGPSLAAAQDWWGSAVAADVASSVQGPVNTANFLTSEPLLTPALGTSNNVTQVGGGVVNLRLACRTAESMRLSEDSTFTSVFFGPFTNAVQFPLSEGGGQKTIFAQFRSTTGQTSAPISISITYITAGPTITSFNLNEGQVLNRPLVVTASASAPLGMAAMEFYVDNVGQGTNAGGTFSQWFDVRSLSGVHRVKLVARDSSGNFATLERNVTITPNPPPSPVITTPPADLVLNTNSYPVAGTAEPFISVRLILNSIPVGTVAADAAGNWSFASVPLTEGSNSFVASAFDTLGAGSSSPRTIVKDTGPPAALVMDAPSYIPGGGLTLGWHFATTGERAVKYRVVWNATTFTDPAQASGQGIVVNGLSYTPTGIAPGTYYFGVVGYDDAGNASQLSNLVLYDYDPLSPSFSIAFDHAAPVGVGSLGITVTSSEPLADVPSLTLRPFGSQPVALLLSNAAVNTYSAALRVTGNTPSGPMTFMVAGQDLAGNRFNGPPSGPPMVIDVTPPSAAITTAPEPPVQVTNTTDVTVSVMLSEPPKLGTLPLLSFAPPTGSDVPVPLTGSGSNWLGSMALTPAMGSGFGAFSLSVTDALDNVGHLITSGAFLEIYNTALPSAPSQPVNFHVVSLSGGREQLTWNAVSNAEIYRVYSEPGTNLLITPTNLVVDNVTSNAFIDLPATDGYYRYAVTASRRGSEGPASIVRVVLSDRTPPPAPANVTVQLLARGVQVSWQPGSGETADHYKVYRNGTAIATLNVTRTNITDSPPRGVMSYTVAAADALGNEAESEPATIELLVGAVNNLAAFVTAGDAPSLTWSPGDNTAVGYNVYRNDIKQNATPLPTPNFVDPLGVPAGASVTYDVRAVNSTNAESAPSDPHCRGHRAQCSGQFGCQRREFSRFVLVRQVPCHHVESQRHGQSPLRPRDVGAPSGGRCVLRQVG